MEAKKYFVDPRASVATTQQQLHSQEASPAQVSTLTSFLQSCMKLLRNQNALNELQKFMQSCEPHQSSDRGKTINRVRRTRREMRLHAQIGDYDMTDIILDLGSEVNVLTRKTWEQMGRPTLDFYLLTFKASNTCINNDGKLISVKRIPRKTTVR